MEQYSVTGMSCAACSARVERAVSGVEGVTACSVSLLTNSMRVEGTAPPQAVIAAVTNAGYGAAVQGENTPPPSDDALRDTETPKLRRRLIVSLILLLVLMYVSMGSMLGLPRVYAGYPAANGILQMLLSGIIMTVNQRFFISGTNAVLHRAPNMDTLVALGSVTSFVWSTAVLLETAVSGTEGQLYFESAAMIVTLITLGKLLEARAKGKTTDALRGLLALAPKTAVIETDSGEQEVPVDRVQRGTVFLVKPGAQIPADGVILSGAGAVDESALTGESIPVDKTAGDSVSAGTINQAGFLRCEATRTGNDTALSQIIRMVQETAATKAPIAKTADRIAGIFVPAVISVAVLTAVIWLLLGESGSFALARGVAVLVISCPCALGLATPVAVMVGSGVGAKNRILFKTAASLEETGRIRTVVVDKTGTVTEGKPRITDLLPASGISEETLLRAAAAVEQHSEHPLAKAVMALAAERGIEPEAVTDFAAEVGNGVHAVCNGHMLSAGSLRNGALPDDIRNVAESCAASGKTPLIFRRDGQYLGMLAAADIIRPDSRSAVQTLRAMGISVVMLTGDNVKTAAAIGQQAGVDRVIAGVLPAEKREVIESLKTDGKVCMIGDGINDAPALTAADAGIAIGAGTDIAIDAADVVLMQSRLTDAVTAIQLSRKTLRNIRENLFWAFIYNVIGIPVAAGVFVPLGLTLPPMFGAAAMSISSFCVVSNALRLNFFKPVQVSEKDAPAVNMQIENRKGKVETMAKKTLFIDGMMCGKCETHVQKALSKMEGVTVLSVSHTENTAVIEGENLPDEAALRAVIDDAGYELKGVQ
ncbi:MAG: cadmium-translocating P-type ATPase [Oscillospiraceae bacterium]|nr:cadmium-translocating P-type ATPase [Oscillospiraceae bacterium]